MWNWWSKTEKLWLILLVSRDRMREGQSIVIKRWSEKSKLKESKIWFREQEIFQPCAYHRSHCCRQILAKRSFCPPTSSLQCLVLVMKFRKYCKSSTFSEVWACRLHISWFLLICLVRLNSRTYERHFWKGILLAFFC